MSWNTLDTKFNTDISSKFHKELQRISKQHLYSDTYMITLSSKLLISVVAELLLSFVTDKYGLKKMCYNTFWEQMSLKTKAKQ